MNPFPTVLVRVGGDHGNHCLPSGLQNRPVENSGGSIYDRSGKDAGESVGYRIGSGAGVSDIEPPGRGMDLRMVGGTEATGEAGVQAPDGRGCGRRALNIQRWSDLYAAAVETAELAMARLHVDRLNERLILRTVRALRRCDRLRDKLSELMATGNL